MELSRVNAIGSNTGPITGIQKIHAERNSTINYSLQMHQQTATSFNPTETDQYFDTVTANLSKLYIEQESWFIPLPWEDDLCLLPEEHFVNLEMQILDRKGQMDRGCATNLEDLLNPLPEEGSVGPRQILIRGNAGYGKSTLLSKIGYDWAKNIETFKSVSWKGTLLLLYRLRELEDGADIEEELFKLVQYRSARSSENFQTTKDRLHQFRGRILILLDGYDEVRVRNIENVRKFLGNRPNEPESVFRSAITILTSRMISEKKFLRQFDRHFVIKGLTPENVKSLIRKYYKDYPEEVDSCFHLLSSFRTLWNQNLSPILVILICFVKHNENIDNLEGTDELFLRVMFLTAQRARERENIEMTGNDIWDIFDKLGILFLQHAQEREVFVTHDELFKLFSNKTAFVESCGVLRKPASSLRKETNQFEPVHKLLMDCLIFYSLNHLFSINEIKCEYSEFLENFQSELDNHILKFVWYCEKEKFGTNFVLFTNKEWTNPNSFGIKTPRFRIHRNEGDTSGRFSMFGNTIKKELQYSIRLKPQSKCMENFASIFNNFFPKTHPLHTVAGSVLSLPQESLVFWNQTNKNASIAFETTKDVLSPDQKEPEAFPLFFYLANLLRIFGYGGYLLSFFSKGEPNCEYLYNYVKRLITDPKISISLRKVQLEMCTQDLSTHWASDVVIINWNIQSEKVSIRTSQKFKVYSKDYFIVNGEELLNEYSRNKTKYIVNLYIV